MSRSTNSDWNGKIRGATTAFVVSLIFQIRAHAGECPCALLSTAVASSVALEKPLGQFETLRESAATSIDEMLLRLRRDGMRAHPLNCISASEIRNDRHLLFYQRRRNHIHFVPLVYVDPLNNAITVLDVDDDLQLYAHEVSREDAQLRFGPGCIEYSVDYEASSIRTLLVTLVSSVAVAFFCATNWTKR